MRPINAVNLFLLVSIFRVVRPSHQKQTKRVYSHYSFYYYYC